MDFPGQLLPIQKNVLRKCPVGVWGHPLGGGGGRTLAGLGQALIPPLSPPTPGGARTLGAPQEHSRGKDGVGRRLQTESLGPPQTLPLS